MKFLPGEKFPFGWESLIGVEMKGFAFQSYRFGLRFHRKSTACTASASSFRFRFHIPGYKNITTQLLVWPKLVVNYLTVLITLVFAERCFSSAEWTARKPKLRWRRISRLPVLEFVALLYMNMFCSEITTLHKFAVTHYVVLFCPNNWSFIRNGSKFWIRKIGF